MSANACLGCTGACCEDVLVGITGYDAWRLANAHGEPIAAFATIASAEADDLGAFRFGDGYAALVLARNPARTRACGFLVRATGGAGRCGTYESRPVVCRTYPMTLRDDRIALRDDVVCSAADWDLATIAEELWRSDLRRYARECEIYATAIAVWNRSSLDGLAAYAAFVMAAFSRIDAARAADVDAEPFDLANEAIASLS